jgi:hypothetical protein
MNKPAKSEVYCLRLSGKLRTALQAAAKDERASIDAILERAVREWLARRRLSNERALGEEEDAEQRRQLRERVMKAVGTISVDLGGSSTNERVR